MFTATRYSTTAFVSRVVVTKSPLRLAALGAEKSMSTMAATTPTAAAGTNQAEVVLVGCGAPNRGMGWYHAVQMLDKKYVVCHVCECVCTAMGRLLFRQNVFSHCDSIWLFHSFQYQPKT